MIRPYRQTSQSPTCPSGARIGRTGRKALWYRLHWSGWSEMWTHECRAAVYRVSDPWGRCWGWSQRCTGCTWHRIVWLSAVCPCLSVEIVGWIDGRVHWALPWDRFRQNHRCRWSPDWSGCTVGTWRDWVCVLRSCWVFQSIVEVAGPQGFARAWVPRAPRCWCDACRVHWECRSREAWCFARCSRQGYWLMPKCVPREMRTWDWSADDRRRCRAWVWLWPPLCIVSTVTDEGPVAVGRVESNVDFHLRREELVRVESRNLSQRQVEGLVPQVAIGTASVVREGENFLMGKVGIIASVGAWVNGHVALQDTPGFLSSSDMLRKARSHCTMANDLGVGMFTCRPLILISMCEKAENVMFWTMPTLSSAMAAPALCSPAKK